MVFISDIFCINLLSSCILLFCNFFHILALEIINGFLHHFVLLNYNLIMFKCCYKNEKIVNNHLVQSFYSYFNRPLFYCY